MSLEALPTAETISPKESILVTVKSPKALTILSKLIITVLNKFITLVVSDNIESSISLNQFQRLPSQLVSVFSELPPSPVVFPPPVVLLVFSPAPLSVELPEKPRHHFYFL